MKKSLIALALVAGCGASDQQGGNAAGPALANAGAGATTPGQAPARQAGGASLTGLYESGPSKQPSQLCMMEKAGVDQFGLVVWGANLHGCSGAGQVERSGDRLRLKMDGDSACTIEATISGGSVTLSQTVPAGCSYYCGAGARMEGARFTRKGTTAADARKAVDLAGDPLCG